MFPPVYEVLRPAPGVGAVVGDRIGAHGEIETSADRPYITWQIISGEPERGVDDLPDVDAIMTQINCWHGTDAGVRALAQAVVAAVEPHAYVTGIPIDQREPDTRLYWIAIQVDWWVPR